MSAMDLPGRLLAAAVAALPERRREWGRAMTAELAEVQGRSAGGGSRSAVFAVTVTALVGAMVVLAVARSRRARPRLPVPAPTILVTGGVAASIAVTVVFLRREPTAAQDLPPPAAT